MLLGSFGFRKFEANFGLVGGGGVDRRGCGDGLFLRGRLFFGFFLFLALRLEGAEFGDIFVAHAAKAGFLEAQVFELAFILEVSLEFEFERGELVGEFGVADGVDAGFEGWNAEEAPLGANDGLYEVFFEGAHGLVVFDEDCGEFLVGFDVVVGEKDGQAG